MNISLYKIAESISFPHSLIHISGRYRYHLAPGSYTPITHRHHLSLFRYIFRGTKKKRRYLIYYAISLITEKIDSDIKIISKPNIINNALDNLDIIYKQIKKNEVKSKTSFLFDSSKEANLETTKHKLNIMSEMFKLN